MATIRMRTLNDRVVHTRTITITSFSCESVETIDESANPEAVLIRKIEGLSEMLGCTEAEAQRLIFERCNSF